MSNPRAYIQREQILRMLDGHTVQLPTSVGLLELVPTAADPWQPLEQIPAPKNMRQRQRDLAGDELDELWRNDTYEVMVYGGRLDGVHLSIKRYDRAAVRNWRHLQQIKNEIVGPEVEAMELFPRESRLADNANQYHLWCLPPGMDIPVGWEQGMVLIEEDEVEAYNSAPHDGRQEPRQEGLTVGDALQGARLPEQARAVRRMLGVEDS